MTIVRTTDAEVMVSVEKQKATPTVEHEARGTHLLATFHGCRATLNDIDALQQLVSDAVIATGATIMQLGCQRFEPQGVTIFAVLAESHASLHTYPESNVVFWDCFTCGDRCRPQESIDVLVKALSPNRTEKQVVVR